MLKESLKNFRHDALVKAQKQCHFEQSEKSIL